MFPVHVPTAPAPAGERYLPLPSGTTHLDLVRLAELPFAAGAFETRRAGEGLDRPARTVGYTGLLLAGGGLDTIGDREAAGLCRRARPDADCTEAAKEKVILCDRDGATHVYQADRQNGTAALCACGNATGAAAALLARTLGRSEVRQAVQLPDGPIMVRAAVAPAGAGWRVEQAWVGVGIDTRPARLLGREVVVCTGPFNDYLIVRLPSTAEFDAFDLPDALALWSEARRLGGFEDPLRSRLVAIAPRGDRPVARFYTCGRLHPGAPLTGLAVLALAARSGRLADLLEGGAIEHRRGVDALPAIAAGPEGTEVRFPAIDVRLRPFPVGPRGRATGSCMVNALASGAA